MPVLWNICCEQIKFEAKIKVKIGSLSNLKKDLPKPKEIKRGLKPPTPVVNTVDIHQNEKYKDGREVSSSQSSDDIPAFLEQPEYNGGNDSLVDTREIRLNKEQQTKEKNSINMKDSQEIRKTFAAEINMLLAANETNTMSLKDFQESRGSLLKSIDSQ